VLLGHQVSLGHQVLLGHQVSLGDVIVVTAVKPAVTVTT